MQKLDIGRRVYFMLRVPVLFVLGLALLSIVAYGQDTSSIVGTVTDGTGAVVANAKVDITNIETGFVRSTTTNSTGNYTAPDLLIGHYKVRVEAKGFKAFEEKGITLNVSATVRVNAALQVGAQDVTVNIEANAVAVQADTSEVSQTVTSTEVSELSTNGRNILQLTALVPGASSTMPDFDSPVAQFQNRSVYFNGQRSDHNNWVIDGGEAYDRGGGGILIVAPSQETIGEFKVSTSNYGADQGNASGGMINMALKQGTKTFHGGVWEYDRDGAFQADKYLDKLNSASHSSLHYNVYGFNIGGPAKIPHDGDKTFFFYNMERRKLTQGSSIYNPVPAAANYGALLGGTGNPDMTNLLTNGLPLQVPATTDPVRLAAYAAAGVTASTAGHPSYFPNNKIPLSLVNPNAKTFLASGAIKLPNSADGQHFYSNANSVTDYREEAARVDHQFNQKLAVFSHLIYDDGTQTAAIPTWTSTTFPTIGSKETVPSWAGVVHATYTISPTLLNETSFNLNGNNLTIAPTGMFTRPAGWTASQLYPNVNTINKMPTINVTGGLHGFNFDPANWPWGNTWRSYTYKDDLSWMRGAHSVKFGAAILHTRKVQQIFVNVGGNYQFNGSATGVGLADFMLGDAASFQQGEVADSVNIVFNNYNIYLNDDWRASKRLTLNLGVRWEGLPHAYDSNQRASNFYPDLYDKSKAPQFLSAGSDYMNTAGPGFQTVSGVTLSKVPFYMNGVGIAGRNGIPDALVNVSKDHFAPRIGFEYDMTGDGATILRGGFGVFYERTAGNEEYNMGSNPPFNNSTQVNTVDLTNPLTDYTTGATSGSSPTTPEGITGVTTKYPVPTTYQYNLGVQRSLHKNLVFDLAYVGNEQKHQTQTININTIAESNMAARKMICGSKCGYTGAGVKSDLYVPYLGFGGINLVSNGGEGNYNSLQASVRGQLKDLTVNAMYTWSHAFDIIDGELWNNVNNPFNPKYDYGTSGFDRRHIAVFTYVYKIPFLRASGNHLTKIALGGWTFSGITQIQSGTPVTVGGINDYSGGSYSGNRATQTAKVSYARTFKSWFDPLAAFTNPGPYQLGAQERNQVVGPGRTNFNMSLFKTFQFTERLGLEFRIETFNTFNHTQFTGIDSNLNDGGGVNALADPRTFQFGAKLQF